LLEKITIDILCKQAGVFSSLESNHDEASLYGITDGKALGTDLEHQFKSFLSEKYIFEEGSSASGIDFPCLNVDMKVTSIRQPQSSCSFKSARQKIYGLGYGLIVFVYDKFDDDKTRKSKLKILDTVFVEKHRTGDFQTTRGLRHIIQNEGNLDDLTSFLIERNLPADEIGLNILAEEIIKNVPDQGFLTISNALQWRLQYSRVIEKAEMASGVRSIYKES